MNLLNSAMSKLLAAVRRICSPARWLARPVEPGQASRRTAPRTGVWSAGLLQASSFAAALVILMLTSVKLDSWRNGLFTESWLNRLSFGVPAMIMTVILGNVLVWRFLGGATVSQASVDRAWKAGVRLLRKNGIDIASTPLYLIVGDDSAADRVIESSGEKFLVAEKAVDEAGGQAPFRWYANESCIIVICSGVGRTATAVRTSAEDPGGGGGDLGTIQPNRTRVRSIMARFTPPVSQNEAMADFACLCQHLRRARNPDFPCYGVLVIVPCAKLGNLSDKMNLANTVGGAIRSDLDTLVEFGGIVCSTNVLISQMQDEAGFAEFVRRRPERNRNSRLGVGVDFRQMENGDAISAVIDEACARFSGLVFEDFKEKDGFTRNFDQLFRIQSFVRTKLADALERLLEIGFVKTDGATPPMLLAGIYLGATGDDDSGAPGDAPRAFLKGIFQKLVDPDFAVVRWTNAAKREERERIRRWENFCKVLLGVSLAAAIVLALLMGFQTKHP